MTLPHCTLRGLDATGRPGTAWFPHPTATTATTTPLATPLMLLDRLLEPTTGRPIGLAERPECRRASTRGYALAPPRAPRHLRPTSREAPADGRAARDRQAFLAGRLAAGPPAAAGWPGAAIVALARRLTKLSQELAAAHAASDHSCCAVGLRERSGVWQPGLAQ
jgi:hypothetical protein